MNRKHVPEGKWLSASELLNEDFMPEAQACQQWPACAGYFLAAPLVQICPDSTGKTGQSLQVLNAPCDLLILFYWYYKEII